MKKELLKKASVVIVGAKPNKRPALRKMMTELGCENRNIEIIITIQETLNSIKDYTDNILILDDDCRDIETIDLLISKFESVTSDEKQSLFVYITNDVTSNIAKKIALKENSILITKPYTISSFNTSFEEYFAKTLKEEAQAKKEKKRIEKETKKNKILYSRFDEEVKRLMLNDGLLDDEFVKIAHEFLSSLNERNELENIGEVLSIGVLKKRYLELESLVDGWLRSSPVKDQYIPDISRVILYNKRFELFNKLKPEDNFARTSIGIGMVLAGSVLIKNQGKKEFAIEYIKNGIKMADYKLMVTKKAIEILIEANELKEAEEIYNNEQIAKRVEDSKQIKELFAHNFL